MCVVTIEVFSKRATLSQPYEMVTRLPKSLRDFTCLLFGAWKCECIEWLKDFMH